MRATQTHEATYSWRLQGGVLRMHAEGGDQRGRCACMWREGIRGDAAHA